MKNVSKPVEVESAEYRRARSRAVRMILSRLLGESAAKAEAKAEVKARLKKAKPCGWGPDRF